MPPLDDVPLGDVIAAWLRERAGKFNASAAPKALTKLKKGGWAASRLELAKEILAERLTGESVRHYVTDAMQWGIDQQGSAIDAYEAHTGTLVKRLNYVTIPHPRIDNLAASPDGMIGGDGLVEVKCPTTTTFVDWRLAGVLPEEHRPQMLLQCAITGRKWCEFVAFDSRIRGGLEAQLFIRRLTPTAEEIAAIEAEAEAFLAEVDAMWEQLTTAGA